MAISNIIPDASEHVYTRITNHLNRVVRDYENGNYVTDILNRTVQDEENDIFEEYGVSVYSPDWDYTYLAFFRNLIFNLEPPYYVGRVLEGYHDSEAALLLFQ